LLPREVIFSVATLQAYPIPARFICGSDLIATYPCHKYFLLVIPVIAFLSITLGFGGAWWLCVAGLIILTKD
jgi:hypothetical protein